MKVFTHSLQSEDDTLISQKEEKIHTEVGSSSAQDTESNTDPNPTQPEPLSTNNSTSQDITVPREDSIPQLMEKQEMNSPRRTVDNQRTVDDQRTVAEDATKEHEISTPTASVLDPVAPALSDDTATAKKKESSEDSSGNVTD